MTITLFSQSFRMLSFLSAIYDEQNMSLPSEQSFEKEKKGYRAYRKNRSFHYCTYLLLAYRRTEALFANMNNDDIQSAWQQIQGWMENQSMLNVDSTVSEAAIQPHDQNLHRYPSFDIYPYDSICILGHLNFSQDPTEVPFNARDWLVHDIATGKFRAPRQNEFLYLLLENPRYSSYLSWLNKRDGLFKIHQPQRVATLWRTVKSRKTYGVMDYDTFARGIRYYYKSGIMLKTHKKYTFRFKL